MVQGDQAVLHVGASAELRGRSHEDPHLAGADFCKEFFLAGLCVRLMDKGDLFFRDAFFHQLFTNIIIDIKGTVALRGRKVAEAELRQAVLRCFLPDTEHVLHTAVHFAFRIVRQYRVDEPLVESAFPSVIGDLEHVVLGWLDPACADEFCAVCER